MARVTRRLTGYEFAGLRAVGMRFGLLKKEFVQHVCADHPRGKLR
jgi:hypothetical protein